MKPLDFENLRAFLLLMLWDLESCKMGFCTPIEENLDRLNSRLCVQTSWQKLKRLWQIDSFQRVALVIKAVAVTKTITAKTITAVAKKVTNCKTSKSLKACIYAGAYHFANVSNMVLNAIFLLMKGIHNHGLYNSSLLHFWHVKKLWDAQCIDPVRRSRFDV